MNLDRSIFQAIVWSDRLTWFLPPSETFEQIDIKFNSGQTRPDRAR